MTYRHRIDLLLTGFFLLIALLAIIGVQDLPSDDQLFPITAGTLLLVATCIYAFRVLTRRHVDESSETPTILDLPSHEKVTILKMIIYISSLVLGVMLFGHLVTVPLFVFIYMLAHGENLGDRICRGVCYADFCSRHLDRVDERRDATPAFR